ncbi:L chain of carbamoyl-phosphate synthase [Helicosporidium sp. ATCC 50920]|nr:L chain of carbamoyl-phosphate synthase [Helicosporidium sp. ATCC 50920]|eukprot:KDD75698.1 L chain of carbamoyl-phosphate synthase [Helicosporidium sp. ATCC 50920]
MALQRSFIHEHARLTAGAPSRLVVVRAASTADRTVAKGEEVPFTAWGTATQRVTKRTDIKSVMVLGAGPIVIGQACEFDYSGTQACKALKAEGYRVILLNSNPATIMTDPETADATYIGPMTPELVEPILAKERPDAILPTMGGQTALNLAKALSEKGILEKYGVELIGAKLESINKAEDRDLFARAMDKLNLKMSRSVIATTMEECMAAAEEIGTLPLVIRPAFTLGGTGGGIAYNVDEFRTICAAGLAASLTSQVQVEQSLLGWKEYELEVMRDLADNVVIICSIENVDPMGVHTGDSITVAPAQTLTDKEYQRLRDAAVAIIREMGVECGGSNVQMAINPADGEMVIIEMNPRVSRSSALASKATGFPIAKMAARLAMGSTLDGIPNDITRKTPASFEPSIDYVVTKIPRFAFEKFPGAEPVLTTQMKSVGEAMAIGRTFQESVQKALRSMETGLDGWSLPAKWERMPHERMLYHLRTPNPERFVVLKQAFEDGLTPAQLFELTAIDPWFLDQFRELHETEVWLRGLAGLAALDAQDMAQVKRRGFSDQQLARLLSRPAAQVTQAQVRDRRAELGVRPSYKRVDTCAAEFEAATPYMYSSYDGEDECESSDAKKVLILGGGPNRIGQGIEFDYCCVHASYALREAGYETIMMNSNPETVSTDYDTSSRLYFEPLTFEDVMNVLEAERPDGIIVQFGGQTPLSLASRLEEELRRRPIPCASGQGHVSIWGTPPSAIDQAEDRDRWMALLRSLDMRQPPGGSASDPAAARRIARELGYPVMVRPSFVLGGRAMEVARNDEDVARFIATAAKVNPEKPVLVDKFLEGADELDVDAIADKDGNVVICGILQHIEQAGVHSGDSACSIPPQSLSPKCAALIRDWTPRLARALGVVGFLNVQYAVQGDELFIIEANPRASRTVPFVAKAVGRPLAKIASLVMAGATLPQLGFEHEPQIHHVAVKEAVLPFDKFPGADTLLGPEMRSTGEVMGIDATFSRAFAKAAIAAGQNLPRGGAAFFSVADEHKVHVAAVAKDLHALGFEILATAGTADALERGGVPKVKRVLKIQEGRPSTADFVKNGQVQLMVITSTGKEADLADGRDLRRLALAHKVPLVTTVAGAKATAGALRALRDGDLEQKPLQSYF